MSPTMLTLGDVLIKTFPRLFETELGDSEKIAEVSFGDRFADAEDEVDGDCKEEEVKRDKEVFTIGKG